MSDLDRRLNQILPKITRDEFLTGRGLGNDIPFHAFDYPPEAELAVRTHIDFLVEQFSRRRPDKILVHINLFALVVEMLEARKLLDKAIDVQATKGDDAALRALSAPLGADKVAKALIAKAAMAHADLILVSGVGAAYPLVRTHNLLNNLQPLTGSTPVVIFYPGRYDGQTLRLFGELADKSYYRAFRLVD